LPGKKEATEPTEHAEKYVSSAFPVCSVALFGSV
jgi:hypothetical protein